MWVVRRDKSLLTIHIVDPHSQVWGIVEWYMSKWKEHIGAILVFGLTVFRSDNRIRFGQVRGPES